MSSSTGPGTSPHSSSYVPLVTEAHTEPERSLTLGQPVGMWKGNRSRGTWSDEGLKTKTGLRTSRTLSSETPYSVHPHACPTRPRP